MGLRTVVVGLKLLFIVALCTAVNPGMQLFSCVAILEK